MKKKVIMNFLLLVLLLGTYPLFGHKYELSVVAIFQNEAPFLKEWIEFHRLIGVKHFWLYNNNSKDEFKSILKPYIKKGIVELIDWPSPPDKDWTPYQNTAYADCLSRCIERTKWLAAIDIDEFIVPVHYAHEVLDVLRKIELKRPNVGGLMLFWQFFGTSHLKETPQNTTLVENLLLKAHKNYPGNAQVKTICRPELVEHCYVHCCIYKPGYRDMTLNGRGGPHQPIQTKPIRIHHYFTRTENYLYNNKLPRRQRCEGRTITQEDMEQIVQRLDLELNEKYDDTILKYVPALRARLGYVYPN
jgi:Glycosyltransferase family 92